MLAEEPHEHPSAKTSGRLSKALLRLLMKRATVVASEPLTERFRLITLEGPALESVAWTPGQKVQIAMGSAFVVRTYTPIEWDAAAGRTRILGYAHGDGPGSAWFSSLKPGDQYDVFGPRNSLDASRIVGTLAVFGDETSIGLAYALVRHDRARPVAYHFEVDDIESSHRVTQHLGLDDALLFGRAKGDAHVEEIEATLPGLAAAGVAFVLTGKASTLQRLRQSLNRQAVSATQILTKAYWAPGKKGLD